MVVAAPEACCIASIRTVWVWCLTVAEALAW
jgi:hypothetical protein